MKTRLRHAIPYQTHREHPLPLLLDPFVIRRRIRRNVNDPLDTRRRTSQEGRYQRDQSLRDEVMRVFEFSDHALSAGRTSCVEAFQVDHSSDLHLVTAIDHSCGVTPRWSGLGRPTAGST